MPKKTKLDQYNSSGNRLKSDDLIDGEKSGVTSLPAAAINAAYASDRMPPENGAA